MNQYYYAVGASIIALILMSFPAEAYLDPGTGSLLLQGIISIFAMIAVSISLFWQRVKSFCCSLFRAKHQDDSSDENT